MMDTTSTLKQRKPGKTCDTDEEFFHPHQIQHMEQVPCPTRNLLCYSLHFSSQQETYLLPAIDLIRFYHQDEGTKVNATWIYSREMDIGLNLVPFLKFPTSTLSKNIY